MVAIGEHLRLTRADLLAFPEDTIKLLLDIQKEGWRISRTSKTHLVLLAPDGETRLGCTSNKNSAHYLAQDLRKYHKEHPKEEVVKVRTVQQKWPCPRPKCHKTFVSEEKLNLHTAVDHEGMLKCPNCDDLFKRPASLGVHRSRKHGYESPVKKRRLELLAEKKKVLDDVTKKLDDEDIPMLTDPWAPKPGTFLDESDLQEAAKIEAEISADDQKPLVEIIEEVLDETGLNDEDVDLEGTKWNLGVEAQSTLAIDGDVGVDRTAQMPEFVHWPVGTTDDYGVGKNVDPDDYVPFIDPRDSWAMVGLEQIHHMTLGSIIDVIKATGCEMEIRIWKPKQ